MCKSCRSRKMLQNDYLVAKIGVDTAEREPSEVDFMRTSPRGRERRGAKDYRARARAARERSPYVRLRVGVGGQAGRSRTLEGSFSAVSKPIFATK